MKVRLLPFQNPTPKPSKTKPGQTQNSGVLLYAPASPQAEEAAKIGEELRRPDGS